MKTENHDFPSNFHLCLVTPAKNAKCFDSVFGCPVKFDSDWNRPLCLSPLAADHPKSAIYNREIRLVENQHIYEQSKFIMCVVFPIFHIHPAMYIILREDGAKEKSSRLFPPASVHSTSPFELVSCTHVSSFTQTNGPEKNISGLSCSEDVKESTHRCTINILRTKTWRERNLNFADAF